MWKKGYFANDANQQRKRPKNVTNVEASKRNFVEDSDDGSCFILTAAPGKSPETQILIGQMQVRVLIDSDASVNIVYYNNFKQIQKENNNIQLSPRRAKICAYGSKDPIDLEQLTTSIRSTLVKTPKQHFMSRKDSISASLGSSLQLILDY